MPKRKEWPRCHRKSSWQERQSRLSRATDREVAESQGEREPHLGERGGSERGYEERVDSTMTEVGFKGGEEGQARRASLEEEEA